MRKTLVLLLALSIVPAVMAQAAGAGVQSATVTLTASQLQHLKSSAVQLVAAPGSGQMLNVISAVAQYKAGSTPYAAHSENLSLYLGTPVVSTPTVGFLDQRMNLVRLMPPSPVTDDQTNFENQPLTVKNDGAAELAGGDGTVTITVNYAIVALQ